MENGLAKFDAMLNAIAAASSVVEVANIADMAEQLRVAAKKANLGVDAVNRVVEVKLRADRKAGELLVGMGFGSRGGDRKSKDTVSLDSLGVHPKESVRWQCLASVEAEVFDSFISNKVETGEELTTAAALRYAKSLTPKPDRTPREVHEWDFVEAVRDGIERIRAKFPERMTALLPQLLRDIAEEVENEKESFDGRL